MGITSLNLLWPNFPFKYYFHFGITHSGQLTEASSLDGLVNQEMCRQCRYTDVILSRFQDESAELVYRAIKNHAYPAISGPRHRCQRLKTECVDLLIMTFSYFKQWLPPF